MNRTERLTRDVLLFGLIPAWVLAGVLFGQKRVWPRRRRLSARSLAWQVGMLVVVLGPRYAEQVLRRIRAVQRRRKEGAASRTPAPPAPELAAAMSPRGREAERRFEPAERMPPPLRGGAGRAPSIDLGPGPTRSEPSHELD